jgi:F-type H+-transporting ATPase subunit delta
MQDETFHSPVVITYAEALLELAAGQSDSPAGPETIGQELAALRKITLADPLVMPLLVDPAIGHEERHNLLNRVFSGRLSTLLMNFLYVLCDKGRLNLLPSIAGGYQELLDKRLGKVEVDVTVAHRLDDASLETVRQSVGAALKRDVVIHQYVDEKILGGMILRVQDKLIDGSVRTQLASMREKILASRPK